jgi:hypothetical protein
MGRSLAAKQKETASTAGFDLVESNKEWYHTAIEIARNIRQEYEGVVIAISDRGILLTEDAAERSAQRSVTSA